MDWTLGVGGLLTVTVALVAVLCFTRMRSIATRVGSFECALRAVGSRTWQNGYATYGANRVDWFPVASLRLKPRYSWLRHEVEVVSVAPSRCASPGRTMIDVSITAAGGRYELVVLSDSYLALRSWLEAAPPAAATYQ